MKTLLLSPNIESLPDPVFPLGLAYIAATLKRAQIPYQVLDLCFAQDYEAAIHRALDNFKPRVIGLSLRNLDNVSFPNYISYLPFFQRVIQTIRQRSQGTVVLGGSGFALMPQVLLEYFSADFGIIGEGESAFVELLERLEQGERLSKPLKPSLIKDDPAIVENLDALPVPDRSGFDNAAYMKWGGMGNLQTKRGCPFECIYCVYPIIEGKRIRLRKPQRVCDEIEGMLEMGITNLFIVDNAFNYPPDHAEAICREIMRRKLDVRWSCYANPKFVAPRLVEWMLRAGCTGMEFGSDAAHHTMLINLGKNFTIDDLKNASTLCRSSGMSFCHSLLLGGPGETMESAQQTMDTIADMSPTAVICMIGIRVFPKTALHAIALNEGMTSPEEDFLKPVFYLSPATGEGIFPLVERFSKENPNWIFPGLNINMDVNLQKKLRRFGIKGPLWEHMKIGERFRKHRLSRPQQNRKGRKLTLKERRS
jgi:radical SAM superfamily enzyme YgiQ (UPF0313 family)